MIVITGADGFIGSCLASKLKNKGLILVDDFPTEGNKIDRMEFFGWLEQNHKKIKFIFHIGARTDTAETNQEIFDKLNINYSKKMWELCAFYNIPLVFASSAATYGNGSLGFEDSHKIIEKLKPLNLYGESKNDFDKWALKQKQDPPFWAGLKFFNVYGPNEYHKKRMASVVFHSYNQIQKTGKVKLFRSHNPKYKDGEQLRDFIYVKDVIDVCLFFMENQNHSGIYNVGTGKARTFFDLAKAVFAALDKEPKIKWVDIPEDIREKYQYFTEAKMEKLRSAGYSKPFYSLENGIKDYIRNYLEKEKYF